MIRIPLAPVASSTMAEARLIMFLPARRTTTTTHRLRVPRAASDNGNQYRCIRRWPCDSGPPATSGGRGVHVVDIYSGNFFRSASGMELNSAVPGSILQWKFPGAPPWPRLFALLSTAWFARRTHYRHGRRDVEPGERLNSVQVSVCRVSRRFPMGG